ncbi:hypothetical protein Sjap_000602 [Stephania japonica]|uniref:Uncharacterized protein n=1 Tax=Stephania japonica TaxID=461633 RepID=A0AAP0KKQ9_9MAGN
MAAKDSNQKALVRFEAKGAELKAAAEREEERIAELKKTRGTNGHLQLLGKCWYTKAFNSMFLTLFVSIQQLFPCKICCLCNYWHF